MEAMSARHNELCSRIPSYVRALVLCLLGVISVCHAGDTQDREVPFDGFVLVLQTDGLETVTRVTIRQGDVVCLSDGDLTHWRSRRLYALTFYGYGKQEKTIDIITTGIGTGAAVYHLNRYRLDSEGGVEFLFCRKILECHETTAGPHTDFSEKTLFMPQKTPFDAILRLEGSGN